MDDQKETPVFVKLEDYKDITEIVNLAKDKLQQAKAVLGRIQHLKTQEDAEFEAWQNELSDIESKLDAIDQQLLEPEV